MAATDPQLYQCELFSDLDKKVIDKILEKAVNATYPCGKTLIKKA